MNNEQLTEKERLQLIHFLIENVAFGDGDYSEIHLINLEKMVEAILTQRVVLAKQEAVKAVMEVVEPEGYTETCTKCGGDGCEKCNYDGYKEYNYEKFRLKLEKKLKIGGGKAE